MRGAWVSLPGTFLMRRCGESTRRSSRSSPCADSLCGAADAAASAPASVGERTAAQVAAATSRSRAREPLLLARNGDSPSERHIAQLPNRVWRRPKRRSIACINRLALHLLACCDFVAKRTRNALPAEDIRTKLILSFANILTKLYLCSGRRGSRLGPRTPRPCSARCASTDRCTGPSWSVRRAWRARR